VVASTAERVPDTLPEAVVLLGRSSPARWRKVNYQARSQISFVKSVSVRQPGTARLSDEFLCNIWYCYEICGHVSILVKI
jgi:hypothetical protein